MNAFHFFKVFVCLGLFLLPFTVSAADKKAEEVKPDITVCAVPQLYTALGHLQQTSPVKFAAKIYTSSDLYAELANSTEHTCDVLLSSDERLPLKLSNTGKLEAHLMQPFAKVKLLLWSPNPRLITQKSAEQLFTKKHLKSIALAKAELTPVGFASNEVLKQPKLNAKFLQDHTYRAINEYQVYAMVNEGNVEAGFVTTPLILTLTRQLNGSYWIVPEAYYPTIQYYATIMNGNEVPFDKAEQFINYLKTDKKAVDLLRALGFYPINAKSIKNQ